MPEDQPYDPLFLFSEIAGGNEQAFSQVVHHFYPILLPFITRVTKNHHVAEEILQEVFLKLWLKRKELQVSNPAAWLHTVAANLAFTWLKREAIHEKLVQHLLKEQLSSLDTEETINFRETKELISKAVHLLPARQQQIFKMSRDEGLTNDEIANKLNISPNTVKNQLVNALRSVREFIKNTARNFFFNFL